MTARRRVCCLVGAVALGTATPMSSVAIAQTNLPRPGSRVRVTAPEYDLRQATGHVQRLTADSITIYRGGARPDVTLALAKISRLEVSTGKRPGLGLVRGAGAGFVIGSLAGLAFGALQYYSCSKEECALWFIIAVPAGAAGGLVIGGAVGAARPPDRWEDVSLPRQSGQSGTGALRRPIGIGLSITF